MTTIQDAADPATGLKITVVSDFICPWCYVGLEVIDRLWQKYDFTLDWAPFFLDPSIPPEGRHRQPTTTADTPKSDLELRAESEGIEIRRGRTFTPHTHLALQASEFARHHGDARTVMDYHRALFKAHFTDHENLMEPDVLVRAAEACGLDGDALRTALGEGTHRDEVDRGIEHSYAIGVSGIPTFILNDQYAVVGAQTYEVFEQVMAKLEVPLREGSASDGGADA
jgi:predicted DsbA family dithiol-disulfide isomerase